MLVSKIGFAMDVLVELENYSLACCSSYRPGKLTISLVVSALNSRTKRNLA